MDIRKVRVKLDGKQETFFLAKSPEAPNTDETRRINGRIEIRLRQGCAPTMMVLSLSASPLISMEGIVPERAR